MPRAASAAATTSWNSSPAVRSGPSRIRDAPSVGEVGQQRGDAVTAAPAVDLVDGEHEHRVKPIGLMSAYQAQRIDPGDRMVRC